MDRFYRYLTTVPVFLTSRYLSRSHIDLSQVDRYFKLAKEPSHKDTYHQITIDIPRTNPSVPLFQQKLIQVRSFFRTAANKTLINRN